MQVFNYGAYARAFELGVTKPNMTKIAKARTSTKLRRFIVSFVIQHLEWFMECNKISSAMES